jgi:predicted metal-binding membrane protein
MSVPDTPLLEVVLRRDRFIVVAGLTLVIVIAWTWIWFGAGTDMSVMDMTRGSQRQMAAIAGHAIPEMPGMAAMAMMPAAWSPGYAALMFSMWWVMMMAMMLPSAAPMLLLFAGINRKQKAGNRPYVPTGLFAAGYLAAWGAFSLVAASLQWELEDLGLLSSMMVTTNILLAGATLVAAGAWQLPPFKTTCLRHCRSPIGFIAHGWRPGRFGAFRMGLEHGAYCLGCCWFVMGLLFVGGIMNLYWIVGLTVFVLLEKVAPMGLWLGRFAGAGLIGWGVWAIAVAA